MSLDEFDLFSAYSHLFSNKRVKSKLSNFPVLLMNKPGLSAGGSCKGSGRKKKPKTDSDEPVPPLVSRIHTVGSTMKRACGATPSESLEPLYFEC